MIDCIVTRPIFIQRVASRGNFDPPPERNIYPPQRSRMQLPIFSVHYIISCSHETKVATVVVAIARTAAAATIDKSYSLGGANVHPS